MMTAILILSLVTAMCAGAVYVGFRVYRQIRRDRKEATNVRKRRESELRAGAVSGMATPRFIAYQAGVLQAHASLADSLAGMTLAGVFLFLAFVGFILQPLIPREPALIMAIEFSIVGIIFALLTISELLDARKFWTELSAEYRAELTLEMEDPERDA